MLSVISYLLTISLLRKKLVQTKVIEIKKNGRLLTSHRFNRLPLLRSRPGGVQQELVVQDLPVQIYNDWHLFC
jgi:hypothetical protein